MSEHIAQGVREGVATKGHPYSSFHVAGIICRGHFV